MDMIPSDSQGLTQEDFNFHLFLADQIHNDPMLQKQLRIVKNHIQTDNAIKESQQKAAEKFNELKKKLQDLDATKGDKNGQVSIYMDGVFDLMHLGHYNAIRQCSLLGDYLVAGVNSDADCLKTKGPTIMKIDERCEILKHCKFVENIEPNTVYTPTFELLDKVGCDYYAHGDDPTFDSEGVDITQKFKEADRFKVFKRTEGVSTTDVTGRLLALAQYNELKTTDPVKAKEFLHEKLMEAPKQKFLATTRRVLNFANGNTPKENDTIVYIQGSFDLLHQGHLKRLEQAKKQGHFLYVGLWDDELTRYYKGGMYPIVSVQERLLMLCSCKHVDDVVIGAPFVITEDLLRCLNIKKVISVINTEEDAVQDQYKGIDQFQIPREQGILEEISIDDEFFNVTTEQLAQRVFDNKQAYEIKFNKKQKSVQAYYENKNLQFRENKPDILEC